MAPSHTTTLFEATIRCGCALLTFDNVNLCECLLLSQNKNAEQCAVGHDQTMAAMTMVSFVIALLLASAQLRHGAANKRQLFQPESLDYLELANIYRYPDAPGQSRDELIACYRESHKKCGSQQNLPCDPDTDAAPSDVDSMVRGYLPENLAELFLLPQGNREDVDAPDIDYYVVDPYVVRGY